MEKKNLFQKDFTLVVIGQIISLFGNAILRFALPLYLLRETGSAALFGIVTACSFLPMIVLSFLGGVLADRVNKRNIMVGLDFLTGAIILVLSLTLDSVPLVPLLIVTLMLLYGISGTYQPTVQASIPALVQEQQILTASAIINQIGALANLLGPIIGGMLFGAFGIMPILIISIACFVFSAVMELFIIIPYEKRKEEKGMLAIIKIDFIDSSSYLKKEKPILLKIIGIVAAFNLVLTAMLMVGMPVLIVDTLKLSDELLGTSQGIMAVGGLCGGIATSLFSKKMKLSNAHYLLLYCSLCVGVMALPLWMGAGAIVTYVVLTAGCFLIMAIATMFSVQMIATVQMETPANLVGKVIALMMAISMCAQPVGQMIYGIVFEQMSKHTGAILLAVALISAIISVISGNTFSRFSSASVNSEVDVL